MALQFLEMRGELIGNIEELLSPCFGDGTGDLMDYLIHFLFDDTSIFRDPADGIGVYFRDDAEARAVHAVAVLIDDILREHGVDLTDSDFRALPEWTQLVQLARRAMDELRAARY